MFKTLPTDWSLLYGAFRSLLYNLEVTQFYINILFTMELQKPLPTSRNTSLSQLCNTTKDIALLSLVKNLYINMNVQTFNDNILGCPLLFKSGQQALFSDRDNMFFKIKVFSVKAKEAQP